MEKSFVKACVFKDRRSGSWLVTLPWYETVNEWDDWLPAYAYAYRQMMLERKRGGGGLLA